MPKSADSTSRASESAPRARRGGRAGPDGWIFELDAGALCLDFVNTLDERPRAAPRELLNTYADLVNWGVQAGAIQPAEGERLLRAAAKHSKAASAALRAATDVREAMFEMFASAARGQEPARHAVAGFNEALSRAMCHLSVATRDGGFQWTWRNGDESLERAFWPAVRSAADLLTSADLPRLRVCAAETCDWVFLDRTKNATRRWCDMAVCGNRAKVREYYRRHRGRQSRHGSTRRSQR
jgi:predicted RNA-binding Zn ribbon-like protein